MLLGDKFDALAARKSYIHRLGSVTSDEASESRTDPNQMNSQTAVWGTIDDGCLYGDETTNDELRRSANLPFPTEFKCEENEAAGLGWNLTQPEVKISE